MFADTKTSLILKQAQSITSAFNVLPTQTLGNIPVTGGHLVVLNCALYCFGLSISPLFNY